MSKNLFTALWALSLSLLAFPAYGIKFSVTGEIIGDYAAIELSITIAEIDKDAVAPNATGNALYDYLEVYLTSSERELRIKRGGPGPKENDRNSKFYWQGLSAVKDQPTAESYTLRYKIRVFSNPQVAEPKKLADIRATSAATETIPIMVEFWKAMDGTFKAVTKSSEFPIERLYAKPAEAPSDFKLSDAHKGMQLKWTVEEKVQYTKDSVFRQPSEVLIMVFEEDASDITLDARIVDNDEGKHEKTECSYLGSVPDCISCDANEKIFISEEQTAAGIHRFITAANSGNYTVKNLEHDKNYTFAMQFLDGTKRTSCLTAQPGVDTTLTELNGAPEGVTGDPRCFIVSAAYGSPLSPHVEIFRWARDYFLMPTTWGRKLVRSYYTHSIPLAQQIEESPTLKNLVQGLLYIPSWGLWGFRFLVDHHLLTLLCGLFLGLIFRRKAAS